MDEAAAAAAAVAASASKKRRRDDPEAQDPPASRDGVGEEGLDLISRLPDEILGTIISRLPRTKEAARTAILSSRWRHIWRSTPLSLVVDRRLSGQEHNRIAILPKILAAHPGPANRLFLSDIRLGRDRYAKFDSWFRSPALDGLEEIDFTSSGDTYRYGHTRPPRPLPPSVLRFAPTLRVASIGRCDFPEINAAPALVLPRLKQLYLYDVAISEAAIHRLLAGCIVLEGLHLRSLRRLSAVRIDSPTLRSISVSVCSSSNPEADMVFQELVIEDAPCLERLISYGSGTTRLIVAPNSHTADFPAPSLLLPRLKQLNLYDVAISEEAIHRLLAGCIMLEDLELHRICGLSTVRVVSPTLRSIVVSVYSHSKADVFQELVIEDAPCLERLISFDRNGPRTIRVIAAPKLTVLGYVSAQIFELVIGTTIVKEMIPMNFIMPVRTVKILALESIGPNLDSVVGLLRCFPCTEKLYIQSSLGKDMKNVWQHDMLNPIECLDVHLRKVVLDSYVGMRPDVNFAKFFVLNAMVLEVMRFGLSRDHDEKWMANQHRRLQLDNRASRNARFDFKPVHGDLSMHIHDMTRPDPFDS